MSNPYSGSGFSFGSPNQSNSRPSYATVAAGSTSSTTSSGRTTANPARESAMNPSRSIHIHTGGAGGAYGQEGSERRPETSSGPSGAVGANWASDSMRYSSQHDDHPPFFTPSYLRHSRHVQRLRQEWERHVVKVQERASQNTGMRQPSLSASSSRVNLSKLPSEYQRSPVQDVVERFPPPSATEEERLHPLPSRWSEEDKMNGLEIMADGTEARFNGVTKTSDEAAAVRSDYPMPKECGIFYFEVTILSRGKDGLIGIGFSGRKANLNRLPGWETDSWAYHGDDGYVFACTASGKAYGPRFASQDVIGCGVNFRTGNAFFTKNGNYLGTAFPNVKVDRLYPSVGMKKPGEHLRINFGRTPFVFDIDSLVDQERSDVLLDINKADVSNLHPPDDESALIHNLVGQYLAHEGYVETARAFSKDVQQRQIAGQSQPFQLTSEDDDIHAINRQKIRKSILEGDIDRALKYTSSYYPRLFQDGRNRDIYFRLRCRKFIEMMRRHAELGTATSSPTTVTKSVESLASNGHHDAADEDQEESEDPPDTQMELDDQIQRETSKSLESPSANVDDVDMDASQELSPKVTFMKAEELLSEVVKYGQTLREEFGRDPRKEVQDRLTDIFAIMAYQNVSVSPIGHLFDARGRAEIAEEVNGAVLVSLGKPSSAALEKVCSQTETLLDEAASKVGGAAAFVNVRQDFLQSEQELSFKPPYES